MSDVTSPRFERRLWLGLGAAAATGLAAWWAWSLRRTKRVKVAALYVYPIKSCRGHSMGKATVTKWGLEDDRTTGWVALAGAWRYRSPISQFDAIFEGCSLTHVSGLIHYTTQKDTMSQHHHFGGFKACS